MDEESVGLSFCIQVVMPRPSVAFRWFRGATSQLLTLWVLFAFSEKYSLFPKLKQPFSLSSKTLSFEWRCNCRARWWVRRRACLALAEPRPTVALASLRVQIYNTKNAGIECFAIFFLNIFSSIFFIVIWSFCHFRFLVVKTRTINININIYFIVSKNDIPNPFWQDDNLDSVRSFTKNWMLWSKILTINE